LVRSLRTSTDIATRVRDSMAQLDQFAESGVDRLGVLAHTGWLSKQPVDLQVHLARIGRWRVFEAGEVVYLAGGEADFLLGLAEGILEITFPLVSDEPVVIHRAAPGFWTGEASILAGQPRLISIAAATRVRLFAVPASRVRRLLSDEPRHWPSFYAQSLSISASPSRAGRRCSPRARRPTCPCRSPTA
jgi:CRP/FNR family transcriptional regulator, cyclic AMP receptor protein